MTGIDREFDYSLFTEFTGHFPDPHWMFLEGVPYMVSQVREAADEFARSYRGFKVGAMVLAVAPDEAKMGWFFGANSKPRPDSIKQCAEQHALSKATANGYEQAVGMIISGPNNQDHGSGLEPPTLHPCETCRDIFRGSDLVAEDTLIMTVSPDEDRYELMLERELQALHGESLELPVYKDPNFNNWYESRSTYGWALNRVIPDISNLSPSEAVIFAATGRMPVKR